MLLFVETTTKYVVKYFRELISFRVILRYDLCPQRSSLSQVLLYLNELHFISAPFDKEWMPCDACNHMRDLFNVVTLHLRHDGYKRIQTLNVPSICGESYINSRARE